MKQFIGLLALAAALMIPTVSFAADSQIGVYVAPKFIYGLTQMDGSKAHIFHSSGANRSFSGSKTDDTFGGSIAFGYDFSKKFDVPIRTEIEYSLFSEAEASKSWDLVGVSVDAKQEFQIQTLFLNAYWDINTGTKFTPYIGAGLGMGFISTKANINVDDGTGIYGGSTGSKTVTNFAWNVGAGLGYDITDNWTIDAGYRFVGLGSVKTKNGYDATDPNYGAYGKTDNLYQHQFALGVRYTF